MFSKACEYALKIMIYLCSVKDQEGLKGLKEITKAIESPEAFTAKILQQLVRSGLLHSVRGPSGGFRVRETPIKLLEIVEAIDGEGVVKNCVLGLEECSSDHPCPVHDKFIAVRDHLTGVLMSTSLSEVQKGLADGSRYLKL